MRSKRQTATKAGFGFVISSGGVQGKTKTVEDVTMVGKKGQKLLKDQDSTVRIAEGVGAEAKLVDRIEMIWLENEEFFVEGKCLVEVAGLCAGLRTSEKILYLHGWLQHISSGDEIRAS
jgi:hypothetical protein